MKQEKIDGLRKRLLELRARSRGELDRMIQVIQEDGRPTGEHDRGASEAVDKEIEVEHAEEEIHRQVQAALERIDNGTYGVCEQCGKNIPEVRLDAIPYAPFCVACETKHERA